jgi:hypothetical protein
MRNRGIREGGTGMRISSKSVAVPRGTDTLMDSMSSLLKGMSPILFQHVAALQFCLGGDEEKAKQALKMAERQEDSSTFPPNLRKQARELRRVARLLLPNDRGPEGVAKYPFPHKQGGTEGNLNHHRRRNP